MPAWTFIAALRSCARSSLVAVMVDRRCSLLGAAAYGVDLHGTALVGLVVYVALGTATMCALGIAVTAFTPTADAAVDDRALHAR